MNNVLLGKTIKAMYKLSGKTLTLLSEESGLTIDTINNLFYARIQKPGLIGVCELVKAMGFTVQELMTFLDENRSIGEDADITEAFTAYITSVRDTGAPAKDTKAPVKATAAPERGGKAPDAAAEDRLRERYEAQISQMRESEERVEKHYAQSVADLKDAYLRESQRQDEQIRQLRRSGRTAKILLAVETALFLALVIFDSLNVNLGWFR